MPADRFPPDDPRAWMARARSNLIMARTPIADVLLEDFAFNAQQAAEKALKAVLIARDIVFPYTHNLARLLVLLGDASEQPPITEAEADLLTPFAVGTRYPDEGPPLSQEELDRAITIAEAVVGWAQTRIAALATNGGPPPERPEDSV